MNILVRVPKSEVEHFWEKFEIEGEELDEFWSLSKMPKNALRLEYIYFQIGKEIVARAKICGLAINEELCLSTRRSWTGCQVYWHQKDFEKIEPLPGKNLTRGFCYLEVENANV